MSELTIATVQKPLTAADIRTQIQIVQQVMAEVMKPEVHYGVLPGTDKPTLYKPGAEVLLATFRISLRPEIIDLSGDDHVTYRVMAHGVHMGSDVLVGTGVGECSTNEEKYKWRGALPKEFAATPENRRRVKYGWYWGQGKGEKIESETQQVRTNHPDLANTVLKMAKKRAEVDLVLTALAVSDMFTQDLEEIDQETGEVIRKAPPPKYGSNAPRSKTQPEPQGDGPAKPAQTGNATEKQIGLVKMKLEQAGLSAQLLCEDFGIDALPSLPFAKVNDALAWIKQTAQTQGENR